MAIDINNIGKYNKQLVIDLKAGKLFSSNTRISEWVHAKSYNYDLSYGVMACGDSGKSLKGKYIGVKYYCANRDFGWDMGKPIVHIYDRDNRVGTQKFYRLIHTSSKPGLHDNSYSSCDEITGIP